MKEKMLQDIPPLLAIEGNDRIHKREAREWRRRGAKVVRARNMQDAIERISNGEKYTGIVINGDNIDYLPQLPILRSITETAIVVVVSGKIDPNKATKSYDAGADNYNCITEKPAKNAEMGMSLFASLNKNHENRNKRYQIFKAKDLLMSLDYPIVYIKGKRVELTVQEYTILKLLAQNAKHPVSHRDIMEALWEMHTADDVDMDLVRHAIHRLRHKYNDFFRFRIHTVKGFGYKLDIAS